MQMHRPPHPGEILKRLCFEPLGLSVTEAAESRLNRQTQYDLWPAEQHRAELKVRKSSAA